MDEQAGKFQIPEIVILVMLALVDDTSQAIGSLSLAIPYVGIVIAGLSKLLHWAVWGIILFWFIMKTRSFGWPGILQTCGGVLGTFGIPAVTAGVLGGIYLVNHPKVAGVATLATAGGAGALGAQAGAAEGAATREVHAGVAATRGAQSEPQTASQEGSPAQGRERSPGISTETIPEKEPGTSGSPGVSEEAFGVSKEPIEKLKEETMEKALEPIPQNNIVDLSERRKERGEPHDPYEYKKAA